MRDPLVRFGIAIERSLLRQIDELSEERDCTRSELLRDLSRAAVARAKVPKGVEAVGTLTLVYDHHVRDLSERLTELQHELGERVRASLHIHLTHDLCLEVVVMRGRSDHLQSIADRILAMRGVKHGGIEIIAGLLNGNNHPHSRLHADSPAVSEGGTGRSSASELGRDGRRASRERTGRRGSHESRPRRGRTPRA